MKFTSPFLSSSLLENCTWIWVSSDWKVPVFLSSLIIILVLSSVLGHSLLEEIWQLTWWVSTSIMVLLIYVFHHRYCEFNQPPFIAIWSAETQSTRKFYIYSIILHINIVIKSTNKLLGTLIMHKYIIRSNRAGAKCSPLKLSTEFTAFVESTYIFSFRKVFCYVLRCRDICILQL